MKKIDIAYKNGPELDIDQLHEFQGELKSLSGDDFKKLKKNILEDGFSFCPHVWLNPKDKKYYLLDGHQRVRVIRYLRDVEKYIVPKFPTVLVDAKNYKQAKHKLLSAVSQYGKTERQGLYEFSIDAGFTPKDLMDNFKIPELDLESFNAEYFDYVSEGKEVSFTAKEGAKELSEGEFSKFAHTCPRCNFSFD